MTPSPSTLLRQLEEDLRATLTITEGEGNITVPRHWVRSWHMMTTSILTALEEPLTPDGVPRWMVLLMLGLAGLVAFCVGWFAALLAACG